MGPLGRRGPNLASSCMGSRPLFSSDNWMRLIECLARGPRRLGRPLCPAVPSSRVDAVVSRAHSRGPSANGHSSFLPITETRTIHQKKAALGRSAGDGSTTAGRDASRNRRADPQRMRKIVRVHYFVRGGFVGYRSRASSKHLSLHLPVGSLDSSGGSNRVCAASEVARVGVESTKKPTPDVVVVFETFRLPLRQDSSSRLRREQLVSELISFACLRLYSLCTFVITDEFIYDNQQSVRELINLRDSYVIWARKLFIVPATSDEYTATSAELGSIHTALLAAKERMNLPLFRLPISIEALDALIKKVKSNAPI
ncbi:hypothetical protein TNCV_1300041 [Trichonephila clavipes]|nr:hypothetical protein TNCV_1300041 [Trichonephila clavipes]